MRKNKNHDLDSVTIKDIEEHKTVSSKELYDDLLKLKEVQPYKFTPSTSFQFDNRNCFYGNTFLYHFQLKNLLRCRKDKRPTIYELYENKEEWKKLIEQTRKKNRPGKTAAGNIFECYRHNNGSIVMFKSVCAKYLYIKHSAKKVLDPTAGWGGRMLGAWSLGIDYTGIDTNVSLYNSYQSMIGFLREEYKYGILETPPKMEMIWQSCLEVDFSNLDYDFVLTSPPYINTEVYEHMEEWKTKELFYKDFFLPLWEKCIDNMKQGKVCFNISPKMYKQYLTFGGKPCDEEEDLKQQLGQQKGKEQDKIYIWVKK